MQRESFTLNSLFLDLKSKNEVHWRQVIDHMADQYGYGWCWLRHDLLEEDQKLMEWCLPLHRATQLTKEARKQLVAELLHMSTTGKKACMHFMRPNPGKQDPRSVGGGWVHEGYLPKDVTFYQ
jgi:hypothetical protein